ncbi:VOC family protein [Nguyenibacter vanlangensis]|uniref:VOC family protein n=1 Tax=Nguyenibacter vanlangensis TaxID=1216886 RepID=A0ABZ3DAU0_9PROT
MIAPADIGMPPSGPLHDMGEEAMIDHVSIRVRSIQRARAFYDRVLVPLGLTCTVRDAPEYAGYGLDGRDPFLWLTLHDGSSGHIQLAFAAPSRTAVEDFHVAALAAGGRERASPGMQTEGGLPYFAASVLDPDRHEISAVCRIGP